MAGTLVDGQLTERAAGRVQFREGTEADDAAIRRLLRENPMRGRITLSFEREPNYFLGAESGCVPDRIIVAMEHKRLICMGRCSDRRRFINGEVRRVGYLSDLRLDADAQGRFDVLRRGYRFFHELDRDDPPDFYFTSIAAGNVRSIQFLERGLPGMPAYQWLADFVTLLVPVPRSAAKLRRLPDSARRRLNDNECQCVSGADRSAAELVACLNARAKVHQLACAWTEDDLRSLESLGLRPADFRLVVDRGGVVACAGLWDQRAFRQTVIHGYGRSLSLARRCLNFAAKLFGTPGLPPVGSTLAYAVLSPLAVDPERTDVFLALVETALEDAAERGLDFIALGFVASDPRLATMRKHFRSQEYHSRFYRVNWVPGTREIAGDRTLFPEVALL